MQNYEFFCIFVVNPALLFFFWIYLSAWWDALSPLQLPENYPFKGQVKFLIQMSEISSLEVNFHLIIVIFSQGFVGNLMKFTYVCKWYNLLQTISAVTKLEQWNCLGLYIKFFFYNRGKQNVTKYKNWLSSIEIYSQQDKLFCSYIVKGFFTFQWISKVGWNHRISKFM